MSISGVGDCLSGDIGCRCFVQGAGRKVNADDSFFDCQLCLCSILNLDYFACHKGLCCLSPLVFVIVAQRACYSCEFAGCNTFWLCLFVVGYFPYKWAVWWLQFQSSSTVFCARCFCHACPFLWLWFQVLVLLDIFVTLQCGWHHMNVKSGGQPSVSGTCASVYTDRNSSKCHWSWSVTKHIATPAERRATPIDFWWLVCHPSDRNHEERSGFKVKHLMWSGGTKIHGRNPDAQTLIAQRNDNGTSDIWLQWGGRQSPTGRPGYTRK